MIVEADRDGAYRCLDDVDDEVRDRAALYLRFMKDEPLAQTFVKDGAPSSTCILTAYAD